MWDGADSTVTLEGTLSGQNSTDSLFYFSTWGYIASEVASTLNPYAYMVAAISGPNSIGATDTYEWLATPSGATGTPSYQWA